MTNFVKINASNLLSGEINLPGSKSISNRVLLLSSIASGNIIIKNLLFSDDTNVMINCLKKLGIKISINKKLNQCEVIGSNNFFPNKEADLFIGNSGTTIRFLTTALAFNNGLYKLHGINRMHERPIKDLVDSLNSIGSNINYDKNIGFPPLIIKKSKINMFSVSVKGDISSQFLSSLILSSTILSKEKNFEIQVDGDLISKPYADITIKLMNLYGLKITQKNYNRFYIPSNQILKNPSQIEIEGDASSASYFLAAATIGGSKLKVNGVGYKTIQGDIKFVEILKKMGANINIEANFIEVSCDKILKPINEDLNHIPDAAMTLAILALYADGTSVLRNIGSWRVKETDRLYAMATELKKVGAKIIEGDDFLEIEPPLKIKDAVIDTYNDHRIAMCFSLTALNGINKEGANITINDPNCVSKTFPNYFDIFKNLLKL